TDPQSRPSCSLVIATRNRAELLDRCLRAVGSLTERPGEIIVVDNTDGDEETRLLAQDLGVRYLQAPSTGLSGARNTGARASSGEVVAFIDDDVVPREGWLPALCAPFNDPLVVAATGRIVPLQADAPA